ncbi:hypothetical protein AHF37_08637 [Paragonimus kellicotti]|nr:hypothetical protein AHF37_08637 [Paragonimus kellicotti]
MRFLVFHRHISIVQSLFAICLNPSLKPSRFSLAYAIGPCALVCSCPALHPCCLLTRVGCIQVALTDFRPSNAPLDIDNSILAFTYVQS